MRRALVVVLMVLAMCTTLIAQESADRAWQQRLQVEIPLAVPLEKLEPVNPFAASVDALPRLVAAEPPRKLDVGGYAVVAAYVDARGNCLGAVPLEVPFPGITRQLVTDFTESRFEPAKAGNRDEPSWVVVQLAIAGRVKEATVVNQLLELPDPTSPPKPAEPDRMAPPGRLLAMPATPAGALSSAASPRRINVRVPSRDADVPMRALIHVTADGRCDRYVALEVDSALTGWLSAFLASWRLQPAQRGADAVDCWLVYTARVRMEFSNLDSAGERVLRDYPFSPDDWE